MKKILLTISDGNGVDNDFKKWPFYLKLLLSKTHTIINRSVVGASNEFMFMQLCEAVYNHDIDHAIIQWSIPNRVDIVADDFWKKQAQQDPVYHFNIVKNNEQTWWVTSRSENDYIQEYHNKYIKYWQALQRTQSYMMAAAELLKFKKIDFIFSLCYNYEFENPNKNILDSYPWLTCNNNKGYSDFRHISKFSKFDKNLAQPHTLINLDWINTVVKPNTSFVDYDERNYLSLEQTLIKKLTL